MSLCSSFSIHYVRLASVRVHLGTLLSTQNNLLSLPVSADGLCAFQVMRYATLTPASGLAGVGLIGKGLQEGCETARCRSSEHR